MYDKLIMRYNRQQKEEDFKMKEYLDMWKNYANFSGTTSVRGYWMATLFNIIISTIVGLIPIVSYIYGLAILIPSLALTVRRLRDAGKHWSAIFLNLIPLVGSIILIVKLCRPSVNVVDAEPASVEA